MNLIKKINEEQIGLLKEKNVKIQENDYTVGKCRYIRGQIIEYIMNFW